ncbi:hypothetical protein [Pseudomonas sp. C2B4]|uniref:hypothetical protein n=1 Tax=Pseudomonas sp. C2B4 TaxID=2735270 RepID=UPI0015867353|nr:hypothetical protein [Pseudomonas sp. C2B4]NUU38425.1 hypothetical protein [Pseudomonas sp. C2B4]
MVPASSSQQAVITFRYRMNLATSLDAQSQLGMDFNNKMNVTRQSTTIPNADRDGLDGYGVYLMKSTAVTSIAGLSVNLKVTNITTGFSQVYPSVPFSSPVLPGALCAFNFYHNECLTVGAGAVEFEAVIFNPAIGSLQFSPRCPFNFVAP